MPQDPSRAAGWLVAIPFLFLTGCVTVSPSKNPPGPALIPGDASAPSQVTPTEAIVIAESYAKHPWTPFAANIRHGLDSVGVRIDTPDIGYHPPSGRDGWWIPGEVNEGVPYKWGGFDDLDSFDRSIAAGSAGGDVSTPQKRAADNAAVSSSAAGVDCSGFISRCLKLPAVYDSAHLPAICDPLPSVTDLRPGDLLNIPHRHVLMFAGWARPDRTWIYFYETGGIPVWKPALKTAPLANFLALGFQPIRYRGMARAAAPSDKEVLTRALRTQAIVVAHPTIGEP